MGVRPLRTPWIRQWLHGNLGEGAPTYYFATIFQNNCMKFKQKLTAEGWIVGAPTRSPSVL